MSALKIIDMRQSEISVSRDLRMSAVELKPGPPAQADGLMIGIADMARDPPHNGELHPDGDELVLVISGRVEVLAVDEPGNSCVLGPGQATIVGKGQWHRVHVLESAQLIYVTPGPNGEFRLPAIPPKRA